MLISEIFRCHDGFFIIIMSPLGNLHLLEPSEESIVRNVTNAGIRKDAHSEFPSLHPNG